MLTELQQLLLVSSVVAAGFSVLMSISTLILAITCYVKVLSFEKSTHAVQYVPIDPEIDKQNEEYVKKWATSDNELEKQRKLYKEELEDQLPEFLDTDEINSF